MINTECFSSLFSHVLSFCSDSGGKCNFLMGLSTHETQEVTKHQNKIQAFKILYRKDFPFVLCRTGSRTAVFNVFVYKKTVIPLQKVRGRPSCAPSPAITYLSPGYCWRVFSDLSSY